MPALFFLLLVMVGYGMVEGDMPATLHFMFDFDFSAINGQVILVAVGQAFFSIGVAMGLMMGFGAYLPREISIGRSAVIVAFMDTLVAVIAGLAIFPIVFANGLDPAEGPGLIFVSLPIAFGSVTGGLLFGTLVFHPAVFRRADIGYRHAGTDDRLVGRTLSREAGTGRTAGVYLGVSARPGNRLLVQCLVELAPAGGV